MTTVLPQPPDLVVCGRVVELLFPIPVKTKERPQFNSKSKRPFNSKPYRAWKVKIRTHMETAYQLVPLTKSLRATFFVLSPNPPQGDWDGLMGGVMDALQPDQQGPLKDQPAKWWLGKIAYWNDGQIQDIGGAHWVPSAETALGLRLEEIQMPEPVRPRAQSKKGKSVV